MAKTAVLYARVSVFTEESVSIARQLDSCRKFAEARGWEVVGEFVDEGVSATKNKPEVREAWSALLASEFAYDAVVVWKVDRLTRRVVDFMRAHETLTKRGAGIVCVEQTIDMTTPEGRAFAQMLAVFAELEAAAISSRVVAARAHLLVCRPSTRRSCSLRLADRAEPERQGFRRRSGPGADRLGTRDGSPRVTRGHRHHDRPSGSTRPQAPLPFGARRRSDHWWHASVERLLHNPMLAGMIPYKPADRSCDRPRAQRPANRRVCCSTPTAGRWSARTSPSSASPSARPSLRGSTVPPSRVVAGHRAAAAAPRLFAGIARCGNCERNLPLRCGIIQGTCPSCDVPACHCMIFQAPLSAYVEHRLVRERGSLPMWGRDHAVAGTNAQQLETIEHELEDTVRALIEDRAER